MEPKVNFYLDRAISEATIKKLSTSAEERKRIDAILSNEPRQIWVFLSFLRNNRIKVYTGHRIPQDCWDMGKQRVNPKKYKYGASDFNAWLTALENKIITEVQAKFRFSQQQEANKENVQLLLRDIVRNSRETQTDTRSETIISQIEKYIESEKYEWTEGFTKITLSTLEHIKAFEAHRKRPLQSHEDYLQVWRQFKDYLITKNLKSSTANKHLKIFRRFIRHLVKAGIIKPVDLDGFKKFEQPESFHIALRQNEIDLLAKKTFKEPHLARARDLMLLQIFTGQRVGDLPQIVGQIGKGDGPIHVLQGKQNQRVTIPLFPALKAHLKKLAKTYPDGLPPMTEQKYNEYIKVCAQKVGIKQIHTYKEMRGTESETVSRERYKLITTHTCRRTFCTICVARGISHKAIMAITGHKSHKIFLEYVRVDDISVNEEFNLKMK